MLTATFLKAPYMPATESLTIEIQGDSSGLSQALDDALAKVQTLQSAADSAGVSVGSIGGRLAGVATAMQPLQLISQQLTRISQQARTLSQQSISLNVQPALSALQSLMSAIQAVASRLSALSQMGGGMIRGPMQTGGGSGSSGGGGAGTSGANSATPRIATHMATSPTPFSLELNAGAAIATGSSPIYEGIPVVGRNTGTSIAPDLSRTNTSYSSLDHSSSTVNHYGGITIEVRETADVNTLMRDLRLQGLSTRHRQG